LLFKLWKGRSVARCNQPTTPKTERRDNPSGLRQKATGIKQTTFKTTWVTLKNISKTMINATPYMDQGTDHRN